MANPSLQELIQGLRQRKMELEIEQEFRRSSPALEVKAKASKTGKRRGRPPKPDHFVSLLSEDTFEDDLYPLAQEDYEDY